MIKIRHNYEPSPIIAHNTRHEPRCCSATFLPNSDSSPFYRLLHLSSNDGRQFGSNMSNCCLHFKPAYVALHMLNNCSVADTMLLRANTAHSNKWPSHTQTFMGINKIIYLNLFSALLHVSFNHKWINNFVKPKNTKKNGVFWNVTQCASCKNRCFG
jgi:hypothetical protein